MHPFEYARPGSLAEAVALLAERGPEARVLAGGTDLVIRLRDGSLAPRLVVDVKRVPELAPGIRLSGENLVIGATTVMTDVAADPLVRRHAPALAEAAAVVGSVQIRNRATLAGNVCNASPAADTVPALLVHGAVAVAAGPDGIRRIALDDLFVRSGITTLLRGELVTAIELPLPADRDRQRPPASDPPAGARPGVRHRDLRRGRRGRHAGRVRERRSAAPAPPGHDRRPGRPCLVG